MRCRVTVEVLELMIIPFSSNSLIQINRTDQQNANYSIIKLPSLSQNTSLHLKKFKRFFHEQAGYSRKKRIKGLVHTFIKKG